MISVYVAGTRVRLDEARAIGKGGEADIYDLGDGRALKVFKTPDHPDLTGKPEDQKAAEARLRMHQSKLAAFPKGLPSEIVAPGELATDRSGKHVLGYAMPLVRDAEPLLRFSEPSVRRLGATDADVVELFRTLHDVVARVHEQGLVIGDFNDLNVLIVNRRVPRVIDCDSFQFGAFPCTVFTERFVDPRLCDRALPAPMLTRTYDPAADWFSFSALLFQSLLFVGPYGGIHKPSDATQRVPSARRSLARVSVFAPDVQYPRPARPLTHLSDPALDWFRRVFESDCRDPFPRALLDTITLRSQPAVVTKPALAAGVGKPQTLSMRIVFATNGVIVQARLEGQTLRVVHHDEGAYRREDGAVVLDGALDPSIEFAIRGASTWMRKESELRVVERGKDSFTHAVDRKRGTLTANREHAFWVHGGALLRDEQSIRGSAGAGASHETVGQVLEDHTRVWVGESFGMGLSRAGGYTSAFLFEAARIGLRDGLVLPALAGELIAARAALSPERAWLFLALAHRGKTRHVALAFTRSGECVGVAEADRDDGTWLGTWGGVCAVGEALLVATDLGLVRVETRHGRCAVTREFPETAEIVSSDTELLAGSDGLYVVSPQAVTICRFT